MVEIILDPGSCHDGSLEKARALIEIGSYCGADKIKFQLLTTNETRGQNIFLPWEWLPELIELGKQKGVEVFASVFDRSGWDYVIACGCKSVKLAYSQAGKLCTYPHRHPLENFYVSLDVMSSQPILRPISHNKINPPAMNLIRLYAIPLYPVPYVVDFEGLFDGPSPRFDGFSSHCLGTEQEIQAVTRGAKYLEFHFQGDWHSPTPDGRFAKPPAMAAKLCRRVKG